MTLLLGALLFSKKSKIRPPNSQKVWVLFSILLPVDTVKPSKDGMDEDYRPFILKSAVFDVEG